MDKGNSPIAIFLDLSAVFNSLDHNNILQKLKFYGITNSSLDWFTSHLKNITQYVEFNNCSSKKTYLSTGVPQGLILGPLLYIIYVNDIQMPVSILIPFYMQMIHPLLTLLVFL